MQLALMIRRRAWPLAGARTTPAEVGVMPRPCNDKIEDVRYWLRQLFSGDCVKMTECVKTVRGKVATLDFQEHFLDILNHACACSEPFLTLRQRDVVTLLYTRFVDNNGDMVRLTVDDVATMLRIPKRTVERDHRRALELIAEHVDLDIDYVS